MTYGKIRGINKEVCTAEQVIAYKLSLRYRNIIKDAYDKMPMGFQKSEILMQATRKLSSKVEKYNKDAVFCALNAGLENYINSERAILSSYSEVSKMFPAYYLEDERRKTK